MNLELIYDILLYFQDWDFPHFVSAIDIKLPGINTAHIKFDIPKCLKREVWQVHITGKLSFGNVSIFHVAHQILSSYVHIIPLRWLDKSSGMQ